MNFKLNQKLKERAEEFASTPKILIENILRKKRKKRSRNDS